MKRLSPILLIIGLLAISVGIILPILGNNPIEPTFRYIYAAGAALTLLARLFQPTPPKGTPLRIKRLLRLESWSALLFVCAAFFAFYSAPMLRDWLAFTLAGAAIQVYASIAISLATRKKKTTTD